MKTIPLTQGRVAIVDDGDYDWLVKIGSWHFDRYAKRVTRDGVVYMHRLIMKPPKGLVVDHMSGDKLDNRRSNLRLATPGQNMHHANKRTGQYKGVSWDKSRNKWKAYICFQYKNIQIGRFDTAEEAARAYDEYAKKLHKEYAVTNF